MTEQENYIVRRGRPPRQAEETGSAPRKAANLKKGNSSWKPASLNEFTGKEDGYRYRMSSKDPKNLSKKSQEGWETVSKLNNEATIHERPNRIEDGVPLGSVLEGHDWVLQRIPEEVAQQRDAYYNGENQRKVSGLTSHFKNEMRKHGGNAPTHGEITISSTTGTQVID